jgi:hypothetical protein
MSTLEQAAEELRRRDYEAASNSIEILLAAEPENPLVKLYAAQLAEGCNYLDRALELYREVLQISVNPKVGTPAREGIGRLEARRDIAKQQARSLAKSEAAELPEPALLVLEPIAPELKQLAAQKMAQIMDIDAYTARLQLPSRGWRIYRHGNLGELNYYQQQFQQADIPSFCTSTSDLKQVYVFNVAHIRDLSPKARIACTDDRQEERIFNVDWSEFSQITFGLLPIFEDVLEITKNRTLRKPKILDYIQVCDLQVKSRRCIFRICSLTYDFSDRKLTGENCSLTGLLKGNSSLLGIDDGFKVTKSGLLVATSPDIPRKQVNQTSHNNWQNLIATIKEYVGDIPIQDSFTPFAESALNFPEFLGHVNPRLEVLRKADSNWDKAFQIYSSLCLCKQINGSAGAEQN